jgi:dihydroorotate dehydrogenase (NAD+) catalytic subunit
LKEKYFNASVISNTCIAKAARVWDMTLSVPDMFAREDAAPLAGQFVGVYTGDGAHLLPRPVSICEILHGQAALRLVYKVVGKGTKIMSGWQTGQNVNLIGPLGKGFAPVDGAARHYVVGGGVGIPPMLELAKTLAADGKAVAAVLGFADETFLVEDFKRVCVEVLVATDSGGAGVKGNAADLLRSADTNGGAVYACGPKPMLRAVKAIAGERFIPLQLSMEERMACGVGACLCCAVKTKDGEAPGSPLYRRVCSDGPVFNADEIVFDEPNKNISFINLNASPIPQPDMSVTLAGVTFKSPVMNASGTFSKENLPLADYDGLGAVVVKGVASAPWPGNPPARAAETHGGMLNAVGLQNNGVDYFLNEELPLWREFCKNGAKLIVNVVGRTIEEYVEVTERLRDADVDMLELNISCPNVKAGGMAFGTDAKLTGQVVSAVKARARQPLIVKLSPNVTDITEIARAAEHAGADALSLINTLRGMRIGLQSKRPVLANTFGGLSGPAVMPVALRMVWQVYNAVRVPLIGMGGIMTGEDAAEFMLAGASAVAVGTASFINPHAIDNIYAGLQVYMKENAAADVKSLIGAAHS